ncbi:TPA: 5-dehydro-4-deoxy-D-glucuronate isomerase, partial [Enterococcus faecium]|nr:5-dehydro-4-deoxy-D-glucuronate isomerase [Enterococcus faecium]
MQEMETRYTHSPEDIRHYSTEQLRKEFLVEKVFEPGKISLTYTHNDRMIFGGVTPTEKELEITLDKELGVDYFLERRELGVINIGGPGFIEIDGQKEEMKKQDGYYIGKETRHVVFSSQDAENPAKFYISSVPAHHKYPNVKISIDQVKPMETGEGLTLNERKIYQYIHPNVCESCQLQMGYTILEPGSAWNTMPCHTHERRMEAYVYFDYA